MAKKMKMVFPFFLVLFVFPIAVCVAEISLSFDISFGCLSLRVVNNTDLKFVRPFKRGVTGVFLISSPTGHIFSNKNWQFIPANSISHGMVKWLPPKGEKEPKSIALTPVDLSSYLPSNALLPKPTEFSSLFLKALIKNPSQQGNSFIFSPVYLLIVSNKRISEVKDASKESIPRVVLSAFNEEIEKIQSEEKSPQFGDW